MLKRSQTIARCSVIPRDVAGCFMTFRKKLFCIALHYSHELNLTMYELSVIIVVVILCNGCK